jgi:hypothetical protein
MVCLTTVKASWRLSMSWDLSRNIAINIADRLTRKEVDSWRKLRLAQLSMKFPSESDRYVIDYEPSADHAFVAPQPPWELPTHDSVTEDGWIVAVSDDETVVRFELLAVQVERNRDIPYLPQFVKEALAWLVAQRAQLIELNTATVQLMVKRSP